MSLSEDQALSAFMASSDARVTEDQSIEYSDAVVPSNAPLTTENLPILNTDPDTTAIHKNAGTEALSAICSEQAANIVHTPAPIQEIESDAILLSATNTADTDDPLLPVNRAITKHTETALVVYIPIINNDTSSDPQPTDTASIPYRSRYARSYAESAYISPQLRRHMLRYVRRSLRRRRRPSPLQALPVVMLGLLLCGILTPLILTATYGINAYGTYTSLRTYASDGVQNLLAVKSILTTRHSSSDSALLDSSKLQRATINLTAAHSDFTRLQLLLKQDTLIQNIGQFLPQFQPQITAGRAASQIGIDITNIGQRLITVGQTVAPRLHGPLLGNATTPLLTASDLILFSTTLEHIQPELADIQTQSRLLDLNGLPLSTQQREQIQQYLQFLPQAVTGLQLARTLIDPIGWLLGIGQPRTFLVQTMDRSELRPTGGFTGDYGELTINAGRLAPFSLKNIGLLEYTDTSVTYGQSAPAAYSSWWPIANWGLRDSNLSADFPTSAQISIDAYHHETNHQVDGVIMFSSLLITYVLQVIGPITIPLYHETITAQNLEERLHFYQDSGQGMSIEKEIEHLTDNEQARKMFTSRFVKTIMDQVRHAAPSELLALGKEMLLELQSKDLQVYTANPQLESLLKQYNYAAQMDRSTNHDGLSIVQANVSASKASTDVRTTMHDTISLNASGGATHILQMRLDYTQVYPVYGLDTYRDYVRIYVPPDAQFLWGNGFDSGHALCGGPYTACPNDGVYSNGALVCPYGLYDAGASTPMLNDPYTGQFHPLNQIGPPTNQQSDETGRAMFGGFVVVPKNCTMTITLSWYVPAIAHGAYELLIQRQSGTAPDLNLTVSPPPGDCKGLYYDGILSQDATFSLKLTQHTHSQTAACIPQLRP